MLTPLLTALEADLRASGGWPPPDGWTPDSPEGRELLAAEPFIAFRLHPLPVKVQAFINSQTDLDASERDAISDLLENLYDLPAKGFTVVPDGDGYTVFRDVSPR